MTAPTTPRKLTKKDFASDQEVRWCPGCGDYSILAQLQKVLPKLAIPREELVFVSGIGCSSRFPYYMNTYGFHGIHGRAPTIASGLKLARPELTVFVITGDGDALSMGGNHLLHVLRRNIDLNIILFNNQIYGLTKGQYSPTSEQGKRTKSSPQGSIDTPLRPLSVALAAEASFVARSFDRDPKHLQQTLLRAAAHKGTSFVEVYQNCNIFNDRAFEDFTEKDVRADRTLQLEHGKPLLFGAARDRGIMLDGLTPKVVSVGKGGVNEDALLVHDEKRDDPTLALLLARLGQPDFPVPLGVFRAIERPTYEGSLAAQIDAARAKHGASDLEALLGSGDTWTVA